ncbi:hypothetical protein SAMN05192533_11832 [Mesobacillus persicus]|uniref:Uncharacterized protein n=1 Tax=Mesobacillus persicus TaxID=930146 RepID=A0A1H8IU43_9BACI|nr:hypothetical protein [Mesobacillus persicus]SEN71228.1 hypothetical protein SAMN05192533_11832 [Mesobacillus persicus]
MGRMYHLDHGYITIPEANNIVKRTLGIVKKDDKTYYFKILRFAKKGWFGGKMHGKRMFQVRRKDIVQYAEELLEAQRYNLFNFHLATELTEVRQLSKSMELVQVQQN